MRTDILKKITTGLMTTALLTVSVLEGFTPLPAGNMPFTVSAEENASDDEGSAAGAGSRVADISEEDLLLKGYEKVSIYNARDFVRLSENCHYENWSRDKYVVLCNDISLSDSDFTSIPIFSGFFDGNGYKITGYEYSGTGYVTGLFRYVAESAVVRDLDIEVDVSAPDGYVTGGIAGINSGIISGCSISGKLSGDTVIGGVSGINTGTGLISDCENLVSVSGYYYIGGITGRNYGTVRDCVNHGSINSSSAWVSGNDEKQIDIITEMTDETSLTSYQSGVDIGGIAGFSAGLVISCRNDATVGYERVGYNSGGICGRQTGIIFSCTNTGKVYGKKDVGGIVGQQEPYIEIDRTKSVSDSIASIHYLSVKMADEMSGAGPEIEDAVRNLQAASGKALDDADSMTGHASDYSIPGDRDWAGIIEKRAEDAGRAAADSVRADYSYIHDRIDAEVSDLPGAYEELMDLLENPDAGKDIGEKALDEADSVAEEAEEKIERDRAEARSEFNSSVNGKIDKWNSGLERLDENAELLSDDLDSIRIAGDKLIDVAGSYSSVLSNDLEAIGDSIGRTYDLVNDLLNGVEEEGMDYLFSDISEMDDPDMTDSRTISCTNYGSVCGDINVGGVAGCLAADTENLENNVMISFKLKHGEGYAVSSIIFDSENNGLVNMRTDCGGGIAGRIDQGSIRSCRGYGAVYTENGDELGGVTGHSEGSIIASYALCTLSGGETMGGIAGYAESAKSCISMPVFTDADGNCGAIAGQVLREDGTECIAARDFRSNYYVSDDYYGIDDISYDDIAECVDYDTLMGMDNVPEAFRDLKVVFVSDGTVLKEIHASYGDDIGDLEFPELPAADGKYGVWPDMTGEKVCGNMMIEAEYQSHIAVLRSGAEYEGTGKPLALLQGEFLSSDILGAFPISGDFETDDGSAYTDVTMVRVDFVGDTVPEPSECRLRLYSPYDEYKLWKLAGDKWTEVPYVRSGSYSEIVPDGFGITYAITQSPSEKLKHMGYAAIVMAAVLFAVFMLRQFRNMGRKTHKKQKQTAER